MTSTESDALPSVVTKLDKQHADLLEPNESFVATLRCGPIDRARPGTVYRRLGPVGRWMQRSLTEDDIDDRMRQVRLLLHRRGLEAVDFPPSKVGYMLGLTQERVMLFNVSGKNFLSDASVRSMFLEPLEINGCGVFLFVDGREAAAVSVWEHEDDAAQFGEVYRMMQRSGPQRRAS